MPPEAARELSEVLGIELDDYGFCRTGVFSPLETSRPGVFAAGFFTSPKDIPDSVAEASGAASKAAAVIYSARGTLVARKELPPEIDVSHERPRVGVFVCHCGGNIGRVVNVPEVVEYARTLPDVVLAEENMYTCSYDALEKIKDEIREHRLNRVVVCACSHRTHEPLFQETIREMGLNPYLFEMANIRDQCSWVHMQEPEKATEKAKDLAESAVAKARLDEPLPKARLGVTPSALVIGGGASGMTAALELSAQGFEVYLVEREPELGGNLRKIRSPEEGRDPQEFLTSLIDEVQRSHRINVFTSSLVADVEGYVGNFKVTVDRGGREHAFDVGAIIVATGGSELKPDEYLYGENRNVLTQLEFEERLHRGEIDAGCVVMIQCVGSREEGRPYCSRVCCAHAIRNALEMRRRNPDADIYILFRDIRTYGFDEDLYREASEEGVLFIRYDPENKPVVKDENGLTVMVRDPVLKKMVRLRPDLVVLSTAVLPQEDNEALARMLKVPLTENGFFLEAHMKLRPIDFATDGIYVCGLAHSPKSIQESVAQACAAAQHASMILCKDAVEAEGIVALVDEEACIGCRACDVCPYNAIEFVDRRISLKEFDYLSRKAQVRSALCKGCGKCAAVCPRGAIEMHHFTDQQIVTQVTALVKAV
ncbi:MAG: FAD-dependent oxidoreductase [Candidatus Bathyarchaeia archaeon]